MDLQNASAVLNSFFPEKVGLDARRKMAQCASATFNPWSLCCKSANLDASRCMLRASPEDAQTPVPPECTTH